MAEKKHHRYMHIKSLMMIVLMLLTAVLSSCGGDNTEDAVRGDVINIGDLTLKVESREFREEVKPQNPAGYYDMYEDHDGFRYYVLEGYAENSGEEAAEDDYEVEVDTDGRKREGKILFMDKMASTFGEKAVPGEETPFILFVLCADDEEPEVITVESSDGESVDILAKDI